MEVDLTGLVARVDGGHRTELLVRKPARERLPDGRVHGLLCLPRVALAVKRQLLGKGEGEALVSRGPPLVVPGLARPLEARDQLLMVPDPIQDAEPDQGEAPTLELGLPPLAHAGDVPDL